MAGHMYAAPLSNVSSTLNNLYYHGVKQAVGEWAVNSNVQVTDVKEVTQDQLSSGEVTWLLNGKSSVNTNWYQTLTGDDAKVIYQDMI